MRSILVVSIVAGCGPREQPTIQHVGPTSPRGFPCGVTTLAELAPFDDARCEPDGSCWPGAARRRVGTCTIAASSSFDLYAGHDRRTVFEGGRPILSEDARPYARTVVFDPRLPTPKGVRVGMTGAEIERVFPFAEIDCTFDDPGWRGQLLCSLTKAYHPECDDGQANGILVVFESDAHSLRTSITAAAARAHVRQARSIAIDLGPPCT